MDAIEIKYQLARKGLTVSDIAASLGIARTSVSQVIHGRRASKRVAQSIADAIGMPVGDIFLKYRDVDNDKIKHPSPGRTDGVAEGSA